MWIDVMHAQKIQARTKKLALDTIKLVGIMPRNTTSNILSKQLLRSATSIGANYRAACRAKSKADFISKMAIVEEEADETVYWLELLADAKLIDQEHAQPILNESNEIVKIAVASIKTARNNQAHG